MRSMKRISRLRLLLVAPASFLLLVATGCLIVPIADKGPEPFPDAALQFLEAGGAGRADVLDQLGEPDWRFDEYRVFVYERDRYYGGLGWVVVSRRTLYIAFDAHGQVVAHSLPKPPLIGSSGFKITRDRVEKWAKKEHRERINCSPSGEVGHLGI
jgi:hypothetical protein